MSSTKAEIKKLIKLRDALEHSGTSCDASFYRNFSQQVCSFLVNKGLCISYEEIRLTLLQNVTLSDINGTTEEIITLDINEEREKEATNFKEKGNELFKEKRYLEAIKSYNAGISCAAISPRLLAIIYANKAACLNALALAAKTRSKRKQLFSQAVEAAEQSTVIDITYAKSYYRLGTILQKQGDYNRAAVVLARAHFLEPNNKGYEAALFACRAELQKVQLRTNFTAKQQYKKDLKEAAKRFNMPTSRVENLMQRSEQSQLLLQGVKAQADSDFEGAFSSFLQASKLGCQISRFNVAKCYMQGSGCQLDPQKAVSLYLALVEDYKKQKANLPTTNCADINLDINFDINEVKNQKHECENSISDDVASCAMLALALAFEAGVGVDKDPTTALKYYTESSNLNNLEAKALLASVYLNGEYGFKNKDEEAFNLLQQSAEGGSANGMYNFAQLLLHRAIITSDNEEEQYYYNKAKMWYNASVKKGGTPPKEADTLRLQLKNFKQNKDAISIGQQVEDINKANRSPLKADQPLSLEALRQCKSTPYIKTFMKTFSLLQKANSNVLSNNIYQAIKLCDKAMRMDDAFLLLQEVSPVLLSLSDAVWEGSTRNSPTQQVIEAMLATEARLTLDELKLRLVSTRLPLITQTSLANATLFSVEVIQLCQSQKKNASLNVDDYMIYILQTQAALYGFQSNFEKSVELLESALAIARKKDSTLRSQAAYNMLVNLAQSYKNIGLTNKAKECFYQFIEVAKQTGHRRLAAAYYGLVAVNLDASNEELEELMRKGDEVVADQNYPSVMKDTNRQQAELYLNIKKHSGNSNNSKKSNAHVSNNSNTNNNSSNSNMSNNRTSSFFNRFATGTAWKTKRASLLRQFAVVYNQTQQMKQMRSMHGSTLSFQQSKSKIKQQKNFKGKQRKNFKQVSIAELLATAKDKVLTGAILECMVITQRCLKMSSTAAVIIDKDKTVERLTVNCQSKHIFDALNSFGTILRITNPYHRVAADGGVAIRVEHEKQIELVPATARCWYCFTESSALMRCGKCKCARYCSSECQQKDWAEMYHKMFCKYFE